MAKRHTITEAEWPIMNALWDKGTATSAEIIDAVTSGRDVSKRTLKALINRLIHKGAITFTKDERDSRVYHYQACVSREEAVQDKSALYLGMVHANDDMSLLTHFVKKAKLSSADIAELYGLLKEKENEADNA